MRDLIQQYKESLRKVRKLKEKAPEEERSIYSGMEDSLQFCIKWMETGRMPGSRRGAERRAAYQREYPADPCRMEAPGKYYRPVGAVYVAEPVASFGVGREIDEGDLETIRLFIDDILSCLSEREREVYTMRYGAGMEYHEIAEALGITEVNVGVVLNNARRKIEEWKGNCEHEF